MQPIDVAWSLLKGNPAMLDRQEQSIGHPVAMDYGNMAIDPRLESIYDESPADRLEDMRERGSLQRNKIRHQAKGQTTALQNDFGAKRIYPKAQYKNPHIERMPRPDESQVANIMDDDIQRLNPGMRNFADASGKL